MSKLELYNQILELHKQGLNVSQIARNVDMKRCTVRNWIKRKPKFFHDSVNTDIDITKENLEQAISESISIAGVLKFLGIEITASHYRQIHKLIKEYNLSTTHFKGQGWNKGQIHYTSSEKIQLYLDNKKEITSNDLKNLLIKNGYKEAKCEKCGITEWNELPAPLELHHKNGNHNDNSLNNLQILCSNCHAQEPNYCNGAKYGSKNYSIEEYKQAIESSYNIREACLKLGMKGKGGNYATVRKRMKKYGFKLKEKSIEEKIKDEIKMEKQFEIRKSKYNNISDAIKAITKGNYPKDEELLKIVWEQPVESLGKLYGVNGNAIRKRCKSRNILVPPSGYWNKYYAKHFDQCKQIKEKMFENWEGIKSIPTENYFSGNRKNPIGLDDKVSI
jgi:Zn finger protein HypA/HybF involved in hydrogenase expression